MKGFVLYFAVFLICVILVYPFSAGAWGFGDLSEDTVDAFNDQTVAISQNYLYSEAGYSTNTYSANNWPTSFSFTISAPTKNFSLYSIGLDYDGFLQDYGCGVFWSVPKHIDGLTLTKARVYAKPSTMLHSSYGQYDYLTGETSVYQSSISFARIFEDDVDCRIIDDNDDFVILWFGGTVNKSFEKFDVVLYFQEVEDLTFDISNKSAVLLAAYLTKDPVVTPSVDTVSLSAVTQSPYYPGTNVQLKADVSGTGIVPGSPESTVYWYVHGNNSGDTYIDNNGLLTIANDETSVQLEIEVISTYDSTKSATVSVPVIYPLNLQITPTQTTLISSAKRQEIQFELLLPNGQPFEYTLIEWTTPGVDGQFFRIDDNGLLEILPGAPAGSVTVKYAYQHDIGNVSTTSAIVTIVTQQEGIYDQLTPTPDQSDKADQMEDAIGNAADKLENNNSSLGQLTPTRPQINTNLEFDQDQMLAVSPLVTNIWSINGLGRMISIVLVIATVAYIFFGKRDG